MAGQRHELVAGPDVPHPAHPVEPDGDREGPIGAERRIDDPLATVVAERPDLGPRRGIPQMSRREPAPETLSADDHAPVGAEVDPAHCVWKGDREQAFAGVHGEHPDRRLVSRKGRHDHPRPVGAEVHVERSPELPRVVRADRAHDPPGGRVPDDHRPVLAGRGDERPVLAELDVVDVARVTTGELEYSLARGRIPDHWLDDGTCGRG